MRRFYIYIEQSLSSGTQWAVFEPNDEKLWAQLSSSVDAFMHTLFLQGVFQGATPAQAYFVRCDASNNPQSSIDQGVVNILVGYALVRPAEFTLIQIKQLTGQTGGSADTGR